MTHCPETQWNHSSVNLLMLYLLSSQTCTWAPRFGMQKLTKWGWQNFSFMPVCYAKFLVNWSKQQSMVTLLHPAPCSACTTFLFPASAGEGAPAEVACSWEDHACLPDERSHCRTAEGDHLSQPPCGGHGKGHLSSRWCWVCAGRYTR